MACPYPVDYHRKPAPSEMLNSLESGRLQLQVEFGSGVRSVQARMVNSAKRENLGKVEGLGELKHKTFLTGNFVQDTRQAGRWANKLSISSSWIDGGTRTYERTGAASPHSGKNLYPLEKTHTLDSGNICAARFGSEFALHWQARPKPTMCSTLNIVYKSLETYGH